MRHIPASSGISVRATLKAVSDAGCVWQTIIETVSGNPQLITIPYPRDNERPHDRKHSIFPGTPDPPQVTCLA